MRTAACFRRPDGLLRDLDPRFPARAVVLITFLALFFLVECRLGGKSEDLCRLSVGVAARVLPAKSLRLSGCLPADCATPILEVSPVCLGADSRPYLLQPESSPVDCLGALSSP